MKDYIEASVQAIVDGDEVDEHIDKLLEKMVKLQPSKPKSPVPVSVLRGLRKLQRGPIPVSPAAKEAVKKGWFKKK